MEVQNRPPQLFLSWFELYPSIPTMSIGIVDISPIEYVYAFLYKKFIEFEHI